MSNSPTVFRSAAPSFAPYYTNLSSFPLVASTTSDDVDVDMHTFSAMAPTAIMHDAMNSVIFLFFISLYFLGYYFSGTKIQQIRESQ